MMDLSLRAAFAMQSLLFVEYCNFLRSVIEEEACASLRFIVRQLRVVSRAYLLDELQLRYLTTDEALVGYFAKRRQASPSCASALVGVGGDLDS